MKPHIREATVEDVRHVANNLRDADLREMQASGFNDPFPPLLDGIMCSAPGYCMVDRHGEPFGLFGAVPDPVEEWRASVWMMATPALEGEALAFARGSRKVVAEWHAKYSLLFNAVDSRNEVHIKWLKWLGFTFIRSFGIGPVQFHEFVKVNPHV